MKGDNYGSSWSETMANAGSEEFDSEYGPVEWLLGLGKASGLVYKKQAKEAGSKTVEGIKNLLSE